ncbi:EF-hand domain-containing protein [Hydrogenophaga soli]
MMEMFKPNCFVLGLLALGLTCMGSMQAVAGEPSTIIHLAGEAAVAEKFRAADLNHDGFLERNEVEAEAQKQYAQVRQAEAVSKMANKLEVPEQVHVEMVVKMLESADVNHDGKVSEQEFVSWMGKS